jgi:hypothetical protein
MNIERIIYISVSMVLKTTPYTWSDNKVRELIAVKMLYNTLLNINVRLHSTLLGKYAPIPEPSPP